jgi:hypothetical protein
MTTNYNSEHPEHPPVAPVTTGGKLIRWVNGQPVPTYAPPLNKDQMSNLITAALSTEYKGDLDPVTGEPYNFNIRFTGMTCAEVMAIRLAEKAAAGDSKSITEILDRILGKPKQSVESVGVKMNYRDYLNFLAVNEEAQESAEFEATTVEVDAYDAFDDDDPYACLNGL